MEQKSGRGKLKKILQRRFFKEWKCRRRCMLRFKQGTRRQSKRTRCCTQVSPGKKKGQGKQKRKLDDIDDGEYEVHYKRAINDIKGQGERVVSCLEKMQEMQMQQMQFMNQFMGNFLQLFKDK